MPASPPEPLPPLSDAAPWGKLALGEDGTVMPERSLAAHRRDVAAVFAALLRLPGLRTRLAALAGREALDGTTVARLTAPTHLHDCGKANAGFQARRAAGAPMAGRRALSFTDSRQGVARLAAKLQQDAERTLTRSFLHHAVQENADADPTRVAEIENLLSRLRGNQGTFDDIIREKEEELARFRGDAARPVPWRDLKRRLAQQADLRDVAGEVWRPRVTGGDFADDPERLAEVFLFRELFRRPKVQNNPETMGFLRLSFPDLENRARRQGPPRPLAEAGTDAEGWIGLALAIVDSVFRDLLAVDLPDPRFVSLVSPRFGVQRGVMAPGAASGRAAGDNWVRPFPGPVPGARPGPAHRMIYALIGGHWDHAADRDRAAVVLEALWSLVTAAAARDVGRGVWRIDFTEAEVARLDRAFLCPVTRRPFGYAVAGRSPLSLAPGLSLAATPAMERIALPRLPRANAGGLDETAGRSVARWCETDPQIVTLRRRGLWTDLHDRIAAYSPFLRAQEHSAQIERKVLSSYTEAFKDGRINLLNCSTTMEMGVDIPQLRLVVNANVPPSIANYRQRAGRAGRRGEPWAFTLTFARGLPLDRWAADRPDRILAHPIAAPRVWFESAPLVQRHVNAALLAAFLRGRGGQSIKGSIGAFVGAGESADAAVLADAPADAFLAVLERELPTNPAVAAALAALVLGTVLAGRTPQALATAAALGFEDLLRRWRAEHRLRRFRAGAPCAGRLPPLRGRKARASARADPGGSPQSPGGAHRVRSVGARALRDAADFRRRCFLDRFARCLGVAAEDRPGGAGHRHQRCGAWAGLCRLSGLWPRRTRDGQRWYGDAAFARRDPASQAADARQGNPVDQRRILSWRLHPARTGPAAGPVRTRHPDRRVRASASKRKSDLPHHRRLDLRLADGQRVLILLDQGFGGWRTQSVVRHDFHATVAEQGRAIAAMQASVSAEHAHGYPVTIEASR